MKDLFEYRDNFKKNEEIESVLRQAGDMTRLPEITIVMPVYNHPDYFEIALDSALQQDTTVEYEIIVVDNNDNKQIVQTRYEEIIKKKKSSRILYYRNDKNLGMHGNWNRCIQLCRSNLLVFLHDDDVLCSNALSYLLEMKREFPEKTIFSTFNTIDCDGNYI
jgi:glycosyltransferase involved in cell wall biosynthesis